MPSFRRSLVPFVLRIARRFGDEGLDQVSASLAFTTLLSLVPLLALVLALVSALPIFSVLVDHIERLLVLHLLPPSSSRLIAGKLLQYSQKASQVTWAGLGMLLLTAVLLLHTVERAFNQVWRVTAPRPMWQRLQLYTVLLAVWPLLVGALVAALSYAITASLGFVNEPPWVRSMLYKGLSLTTLALFFAFLYHAVPNAPVRWLDAAIAGAVAALGFSLLQQGFELYLRHFPSYTAIYGAFAAAPVFLLWVYLSWAVILLGALVAATLEDFGRTA